VNPNANVVAPPMKSKSIAALFAIYSPSHASRRILVFAAASQWLMFSVAFLFFCHATLFTLAVSAPGDVVLHPTPVKIVLRKGPEKIKSLSTGQVQCF
jgi:hypothetical protein